MMNNYIMKITRQILAFMMLWSFSTQAQYPVDVPKKPANLSPAVEWFRSMHESGDLQVHGFASQAYIYTSDNNVFGNSDDNGSFGFTEIGLNALLRPLPRLQLSAQGLSRRAGEGTSATPRLDFAFADYRLYSKETNQFGIRAGRLKNPFGFYNDTRDVAFTRPSILLPQSIYFDRTRNIGLSSDSVQLYGETSHPSLGNFSAQFGVIRPIVDNETERVLLGTTLSGLPGHLSPSTSFIGRGIYESFDSRLRLAVSGILLNIDYDPRGADFLGPGDVEFTPIYLSAQYNTERLSLTSEYAIRFFNYKNFGLEPLDRLNFTGESVYVQGVYRFSPKWEALLRYDVLFTDRSDRNGKKYADRTGQPSHSRFARDLTVGLRWNVTPSFMLRTEYHRVNGTAWLGVLDNPDQSVTSQHWNLFAVQASYRF
jgi:hypothetical protein